MSENMDEILGTVREAISEVEETQNLKDMISRTPAGQATDKALLEAMDVISSIIEKNSERWDTVLNAVQTDLELTLPEENVLAASAL